MLLKGAGEQVPFFTTKSELHKKARFAATDWMSQIEQVILNFIGRHDGLF